MTSPSDDPDASPEDVDEDFSDQPKEPDNLPQSLIARLRTLDDEELRAVSTFSLDLANTSSHDPTDTTVENPAEATDVEIEKYLLVHYGKTELEAAEKAHYTVKHISGYDYFYWQWRDTETGKIKSKYICPVSDTPFESRTFDDNDDDDTDTDTDTTGEVDGEGQSDGESRQNNTTSAN